MKILFLLCIAMSLMLDATKGSVTERNASGDYVVLLHGLGRKKSSMNKLAKHLNNAGYHTLQITYPSLNRPFETISEEIIAPTIRQLCPDPEREIHFVGHSLGCIFIRNHLKNHSHPRNGKVVLLAPPNQGNELADLFGKPWLKWLVGPNLHRITTNSDSIPNQLGPIHADVGVIMGVKYIPVTSTFLDGPDDGVVTVRRGVVKGMDAMITVPSSHTFIMRKEETLEETLRFLLTGRFKKPSIGLLP